MTVTDAAEPGLRERKRRATRRSIQLAVLELVSQRGLDGVTVDEISRVADVSPRTFFNYFSSKEEAMIGDLPELPSDEIVERFVNDGGDLLDGMTQLLIHAADTSTDDAEMVRLRHALVREYPNLFAMRMANMRRFEEQFAGVVERRLLTDDPTFVDRPDYLANKARLVTFVAFGTMRHAWTFWASKEPPAPLSEQLVESFAELKLLFTPHP